MQAIDAGPSQVRPSSMVPYPIYIVTWVKWENVDWIFLFKKAMRRRAGTRTYRSGKVRDVNRSTTTSREIAALIFLNSQLFTSVGEDLSVAFDVFFFG